MDLRQNWPEQFCMAAARRSCAQQSVARQGAAWTCRLGWVTVERQGLTGSEGLGAARREKLGGGSSDELRPEPLRALPTSRDLCGQDPQGQQARGLGGTAACAV